MRYSRTYYSRLAQAMIYQQFKIVIPMFQRSFEHHPQGMGENKNEVGLTLRKQGEKVRVSSTFNPTSFPFPDDDVQNIGYC